MQPLKHNLDTSNTFIFQESSLVQTYIPVKAFQFPGRDDTTIGRNNVDFP